MDDVVLRMVERRRRYASAVGSKFTDVTAPILTGGFALPLGDTSVYIGLTTDDATGTLYYVVTTSATPPSAAQVKAGQNDGGASAVYAGSQAIASSGGKVATATGLSSATAYYGHFMHEDAAANQSAVRTTSLVTTLTTGTSDTSFDNLIAAASVAPSDFRKGLVARFIQALYTASVWTKIDVMWVLAAHDEQFGRLNWKSPSTFTLTAVNSPTFTADRGFAGDGSTSYLDTGWDRSTNGVQFTQNNAHISVYQRTSSGNNVETFADTAAGYRISVGGRTGTNTTSRMNSATSVSGPAGGTQPLLAMARRNDSSNVSILRDGVEVTAPTAATSGALNTTDLAFCRAGNTYTSSQIAGGTLGAYLDDTEAAAYYAAWHDYMVAIGADT